MGPQKTLPIPPMPPKTSTASMELLDHEARLKAEARAYALGGHPFGNSSGANSDRKTSPTSKSSTSSSASGSASTSGTTRRTSKGVTTTKKPTTMNIRRPEKKRTSKSKEKNNSSAANSARVDNSGSSAMMPPTTTTPFSASKIFNDNDDDDYVRFVKSLGFDDAFVSSLENDDEDFHLSDIDEDDDDDEDCDENDGSNMDVENEGAGGGEPRRTLTQESTPSLSSPLSSSPLVLPEFDSNTFRELEEELGSLLEEDLEAAVQSLMTSKKSSVSTPTSSTASSKQSNNGATPKTSKAQAAAAAAAGGSNSATKSKKSSSKTTAATTTTTNKNNENLPTVASPATPLRHAARQGTRAKVTYQQSQQLRRLLTRHYQLLVQQAVLGVRAAHTQKQNKDRTDFLSGETSDDLAEILDGAVGMLQDLDQNRKDAIRNSIQLAESNDDDDGNSAGNTPKGRRSLLSQFAESSATQQAQVLNQQQQLKARDRRLTRAAFTKTLEESGKNGVKRTAFDIPGLMRLKETFSTIDKSVGGVQRGSILEVPSHAEACKMVFRQAGANVDESYTPGSRDLSETFCDCREFFGEHFQSPCNEEQTTFLRKNRNLFTSGEDNLVLRGVNLYGEKQWILIADRYLPDRSVNIISQRYSKLCVMLYKAHGVQIDSNGRLQEPPKLESVDDIDEELLKSVGIRKVIPPALLNVHRWSLEEDLTLLKAVPICGSFWAELKSRYLEHRDRGHLRKRYQVLERRVKSTVLRCAKNDPNSFKSNQSQLHLPGTGTSSRRTAQSTTSTKTTGSKKTSKAGAAGAGAGSTAKVAASKKNTQHTSKKTVQPAASIKSPVVKPSVRANAKKTNTPSRAKTSTVKAYAAAASKGRGSATSSATPSKGSTGTPRQPASRATGRKSQSKAQPKKPASTKAKALAVENEASSFAHMRPSGADTTKAESSSVFDSLSNIEMDGTPSSPAAAAGATSQTTTGKHPGKVIPALKSNPSLRKQKRPPPRLPVVKAQGPARGMPHTGAASMTFERTCSRTAFEQLVDGTSEEWSQMSRMKRMLENDSESQAADAIAAHLIKSPVPSTLSRLPQLQIDSNSMSGLSLLHSEVSRQAFAGNDYHPSATTTNAFESSTSGTGIMARVLENSSNSKKTDSSILPDEYKKRRLPPTGAAAAVGSPTSPRKRQRIPAMPSTPVLPGSPKRSNFYSDSGTTVGLSPRLRPSPGSRNHLINVSTGGISLLSNVPLSPAQSTTNMVMRFVDGQSMDDTMQFCDFQISEESQKALERHPKDEPHQQQQYNFQHTTNQQEREEQQHTHKQHHHHPFQNHDPSPPPLPSPKNSLLFGEHDLEAISALNSLSNSPFARGTKQQSGTVTTTAVANEEKAASDEKNKDVKNNVPSPPKEEQQQEHEGRNEQHQQQDEEKKQLKKEPPKSLFAAVIGGLKDRDTKKALHF